MPASSIFPAPKKKHQPKPAAPRNADTGDVTRNAPEPDEGKVRMFANPQRANPRRVIAQEVARQRKVARDRQQGFEREATQQRATKRVVQKLNVTPVASPDATDSTRSAAQKAHDRASVETAVRDSRQKALRARSAGSWSDAVEKSLVGPGGLFGPGGPNRNGTITPEEYSKFVKKGWIKHPTQVRKVAKADQGDIGATIGVRTTGTSGAVRAAIAVGLATSQDPRGVATKTAKGFRDMATGAPAAIVKTVVDPKGTAKGVGKDYKRRYGGLNEPGGIGRMADRIKKEGAAPEIADAVSIGVPVAKAADLIFGAAARAGRLGGTLEEAVSRARPAIRVSGGEGVHAVRAQARSRGLVTALRESRKDTLAKRAVSREVSAADEAARATARDVVEGADGGVPHTELRRPKGEVDAVVREAHNRGQIVPTRALRPGRRVVSGRQLGKAQRRAVDLEKGRALHEQRVEQRDEIFRGANRVIATLNPREQRAFKLAMQSGALTPEAGRQAALNRIKLIEKTRKYGDDTLNSDVDELPTLHRIADNPAAHFTPRLENAVRTEMARGARVGEGDPSLGRTATERAHTAETRRMAPQAEAQGVKRGGTPIDDAIKSGDRKVRQARKAKDKAIAVRDRAATQLAAAEGYAKSGIDRLHRQQDHAIARQGHIITQHGEAAARQEARAARARYPHTKAEWTAKARRSRIREALAKKKLTQLVAEKEATRIDYRRAVQKARSKAHNAAHEAERQLNGLRAAGDASRSLRRTKKAGVKLLDAEPMGEFHGRVRAARPEGVGEPGFFPSVRRPRQRFSPFTVGGARKVKGDRAYEGKLYRAGREDSSVTTYTTALAKNIKRKHNWKLVQGTMNAHAFAWSRRGLKYGQIQDELARRGVDPNSVVIMDMDAFDRHAAAAVDAPADHIIRDPEVGRVGRSVSADESDLYTATRDSVLTGQDAIDRAAQLEPGAGRLVVVPKEVGNEILADTKPSGAFGRGLDIVKGKMARIMLGLSPAWLQFQVGANVVQTLLGTKSLPHEWVYANLKWWNGLSKESQRALEPYVGIGSFHDSIEQVHMGAAAQGGLINAYRAMKAHPFWHKPRGGAMHGLAVSQLNPLDTLFRLDNVQNNFFRKAVLYNNLRRQAYERMGKSMVDGQRAFDKFLGTASKDAQGTMNALINDKAALEKAAESVRDFLGDYSTYSARERRVLSRNVMFYGYLRWSLRFTFYTMPIKHPVMSAILGQLGGINTREVRELLGGDELPWALGKLYFTKGGKLRSVDISRANPFMNAVTQAKIPEKGAIRGLLLSALGFLPPIYGAALDLAYSKSSFRDKPFKVEGESTTRPNKQGQAITDTQSLEIFAKEMLELAAPIRALDRVRADGRPESDNSIPIVHERYTKYKDAKIKADVRKAREDQTTGQRVIHEIVPGLPQPSRDPETAAKIRRARGVASPSTGGATAQVDPETQRLLDYYKSGAATSSAPSPEDIQTLIDTYGGG